MQYGVEAGGGECGECEGERHVPLAQGQGRRGEGGACARVHATPHTEPATRVPERLILAVSTVHMDVCDARGGSKGETRTGARQALCGMWRRGAGSLGCRRLTPGPSSFLPASSHPSPPSTPNTTHHTHHAHQTHHTPNTHHTHQTHTKHTPNTPHTPHTPHALAGC
jgi:hypothetical protein